MKKLATFGLIGTLASSAAYAEGGRLTVADRLEIGANWAMFAGDAYLGARVGCYEGLTRVSHDLLVEPSLATSWEQTDDNTWVFQIREGVMFQDGTALDAAAVANALNHLLNASVPARAFSSNVVDSVTASGTMEVTIQTSTPVVSMPGRLGAPATSILAPAAYGGPDEIDPIGHCTGPFEMTEVDPAQFIRVDRFDDYWGGAANLEGADYLFVPDANTRATMVRTGEAQISRLVPASVLPSIDGDDELVAHLGRAPRVLQLLLNNGRPPFDNADVRRAVRTALDTSGIAAAVYEGLATPADDPFRSDEPWEARNAEVIAQNLDAAMTLFEAAGVDPNGLELEIMAYNSKPELGDVAEIIQATLGQLGIIVSVRSAPYSALEGDMLSGNYDMAMMSRGYLTDVPEPIGFLTADYSCEGSFNISQHCNPEIDAQLTAASGISDPDERYSAYVDVAQYLYDEAVTVYIINETFLDASANAVQGFNPHPLEYTVVTSDLSLQ